MTPAIITKNFLELAETGTRNFVITGKVWTGKTYLARQLAPLLHKIILPNQLDTERRHYFLSDSEFKMHLTSQNLVLRKPENWTDSIERYPLEALARMPVVIYDDIGTVDISPAYLEKTLYWLSNREAPRITIFTTNLTPQEMMERESRLYSRISENAVWATLTGNDRRTLTTIILK